MLDLIKKIDSNLKELRDLKKSLILELKHSEGSLCDVTHALELKSLDAVKIMKIMKVQKSLLVQRRRVKDDLTLVGQLISGVSNPIGLEGILKIHSKSLVGRKYNTRNLSLSDMLK
jgi:hypothetical protein